MDIRPRDESINLHEQRRVILQSSETVSAADYNIKNYKFEGGYQVNSLIQNTLLYFFPIDLRNLLSLRVVNEIMKSFCYRLSRLVVIITRNLQEIILKMSLRVYSVVFFFRILYSEIKVEEGFTLWVLATITKAV